MGRTFSILSGCLLVFLPVTAHAQHIDDTDFSADYDAPPLVDSAPEQGWAFRAGFVTDWGSASGLVSLFVPQDSTGLAWVEVDLPRDWDRPRMRFEAFLQKDDRDRLLGGLVTRLVSPETDNGNDPERPICFHAWGAETLFIVDGEQVRTLAADACNHNDALFDFAVDVVEAAHAELPECREMVSDDRNALMRFSLCSELTGDRMLAGQFFEPLIDLHRDWPQRAYTDGAEQVEWVREGAFAGQDIYNELVEVRYRSIEGLPQGEVLLSTFYTEWLEGAYWSWEASEIWTRDENDALRLLSLRVANPQLIEEGED